MLQNSMNKSEQCASRLSQAIFDHFDAKEKERERGGRRGRDKEGGRERERERHKIQFRMSFKLSNAMADLTSIALFNRDTR